MIGGNARSGRAVCSIAFLTAQNIHRVLLAFVSIRATAALIMLIAQSSLPDISRICFEDWFVRLGSAKILLCWFVKLPRILAAAEKIRQRNNSLSAFPSIAQNFY